MDVIYQIFIGLVCAFILCGGAYLTFLTYETGNDDMLMFRIFGPVWLFIGMALCYALFGFFTLFDNGFEFSEPGFFPVFFSILGVGIIFSLKNLIAPFFLAIALSWTAYQFLLHGLLDLVPVYDFILTNLMFWAPNWIQTTYIWLSFVYFLLSTVVAFTE